MLIIPYTGYVQHSRWCFLCGFWIHCVAGTFMWGCTYIHAAFGGSHDRYWVEVKIIIIICSRINGHYWHMCRVGSNSHDNLFISMFIFLLFISDIIFYKAPFFHLRVLSEVNCILKKSLRTLSSTWITMRPFYPSAKRGVLLSKSNNCNCRGVVSFLQRLWLYSVYCIGVLHTLTYIKEDFWSLNIWQFRTT